MPTASQLSSAASPPVPMPSESITHSVPESVLKYVPLSPETASPGFMSAAMPTLAHKGSASSSVIRPSASSRGVQSLTPSTAESLSSQAGSRVMLLRLPASMTARSLPPASRKTAASASMSMERK